MRRTLVVGLVLSLTAALSCSDVGLPTGPSGAAPGTVSFEESGEGCALKTYDELTADLVTVFGAGSPNLSSAQSKLDQVKRALDRGNLADAQQKALNLVDFILYHHRNKGLAGEDALVTAFVNDLLCYSGVSGEIGDPDNSFVIAPTTEETIFVTEDGKAGLKVGPNNTVDELTLITIVPAAWSGLPGTGPLDTKLDQWEGFYIFQKSSSQSFNSPVVVAVCPALTVPDEVIPHLRLGHYARGEGEFYITEAADGSFLDCGEAPAQLVSSSREDRFLSLRRGGRVASSELTAQSLTRSGVGGNAITFSTFGTVDQRAGVGGNAITFIRTSLLAESFGTFGNNAVCPTSMVEGTSVDPDCRPSVTITTPLGTLLTGVPVAFDVTAGGGQVAEAGASCGTFGSSRTVNTGTDGKSTVCWTLGTPGANTVVATPSHGGDAPEGVIFQPLTMSWTITATPADVTPPTLTFSPLTSPYLVDAMIRITCTASDPSGVAVDPCVGYAFESAAYVLPELNQISLYTEDGVGNGTNRTFSFSVHATYKSLCNVGRRVTTDPKLGESLCQKLASAYASEFKNDSRGKIKNLDTYISQVESQTGKHISTSDAPHLIRWANWCKTRACAPAP